MEDLKKALEKIFVSVLASGAQYVVYKRVNKRTNKMGYIKLVNTIKPAQSDTFAYIYVGNTQDDLEKELLWINANLPKSEAPSEAEVKPKANGRRKRTTSKSTKAE